MYFDNKTALLQCQRYLAIMLILLMFISSCTTSPKSSSQSLPYSDKSTQRGHALPWPLSLPPGFHMSLYAQGLEEVRKVVFSPEGVPYVTIMNRDQIRGGKVLALPDIDGDGWADRTVLVADKLDRPHGIAFHEGQLYVSEAENLLRLVDDNKDMVADIREPIITNMPTQGDHWSRPFVFTDDGHVFIAIGSSCNICQEGDKQRASILRFAASTTTVYPGRTVFARGLRSVVGMELRPGTQELWVTNNARDELGPDLPPDQIFHVQQDRHYGWPYCYGDRVVDQEALTNPDINPPNRIPKDVFCHENVSPPDILLPPHVAPLGLTFYAHTQFPAEMRGNLFVAYHGAFDLSTRHGYRVVRFPFVQGKPGPPEDFITGWLPDNTNAWMGRPVDVAVGPQGSLYVTDDVNGFLYHVEYIGN